MDKTVIQEMAKVAEQFGTPLWYAAKRAALATAFTEGVLGLLFMLLGFAWLKYYDPKSDKDGDGPFIQFIVCCVLMGFAVILFAFGGYELATLDYQAYQKLLSSW